MAKYDVFLSHNSVDKPAVEQVARRLQEAGIHPFLDKWHLIPGEPWQEALEEALEASQTVAVFVGSSEISPWENEEMRAALEEHVRGKSRRVIPVLLPGASSLPEGSLPRFLRRRTWVDFCGGLDDTDAFHRLLSGIRGQIPESGRAVGIARQAYTYDVFVSYSLADADLMREWLLPSLERAGLRVCIDIRDFEIGLPILTNIEQAVDKSRHTLLAMTPAWLESEWVEFESLFVGTSDPASRRGKLLPLMLETCTPPPGIAMLTFADFTDPDARAEQLDRLLRQLGHVSATARSPNESVSTFIAGPPLTHPRFFFGRTRELRRLYSLWRQLPLQNAAIVGPRRSGKTSLLLYLKNILATPPSELRPGQRTDWLPAPERYRFVMVDFQDPRVGTQAGLLRYLLESLDLAVPQPCDLERCIDVLSRGLRTPTVILLDEIGVALQRYPELDEPFWEALRSLATNQVRGNLGFVLSAGEPPERLADHSGLGSPFFNIFGYSLRLGPLREPEARELVASSPHPISAADTDWILRQSGRWPILLQILCRERLFALQEGEPGDAWREGALEQMAPFDRLLEERGSDEPRT